MRGKGETVPLSKSLRPLTVFWGDLPPNKNTAQETEGEAICSASAQLEEAEVGRLIWLVSGPTAALAIKEHKQADDGKSKDDDGTRGAIDNPRV